MNYERFLIFELPRPAGSHLARLRHLPDSAHRRTSAVSIIPNHSFVSNENMTILENYYI
jgi:hypothetical protein